MAEDEKRRQEKLSEKDLGKVHGGAPYGPDQPLGEDVLKTDEPDVEGDNPLAVARKPYRGGRKKHK